ncbi:cytochrome c oxidase subunit 6A1, mitochondrial-like [Leopardus geoffroyi]|uniref:cytochrome c oxidase subunit 6A1, mitochondrial-like n=1 Tax=Leopardus geoffroyi TaxID=46844 RepID=UPI001E26039B|nr:cytochrome c oxidase subunit 6A1, mitochondrial-like [Leopardus geoffroyi]
MMTAAGSQVSGLLERSRAQLQQSMSSSTHSRESSTHYFIALSYVKVSMVNIFLKLIKESLRDPSSSPTHNSASSPSPFPGGVLFQVLLQGSMITLSFNPHVNPLPTGYEDE